MRPITLIIVMNRWPTTLSSALNVVGPYVAHKVAVVDQSAGLESLDGEQSGHFDRIRYVARGSLDELRNLSLELAREFDASAWALSVDCDEFIDAKSILALHALADSSDRISAFVLPCYNYVGQGRWATTYSFRLLRLSDPVEFSHAIHESISASLVRNSLAWSYGNAPIQHLDFLNPVTGKRQQYRTLLEAAIERGRDLAFLKTLLAMECSWAGDDELALLHLEEAISLASEPLQSGRFSGRDDFPVFLKAQILARGGRLKEAEAQWMRLYAIAEQRVRAEAALALAAIATQVGDHIRALKWADESLSLWRSAEGYFSRATTLCALKARDRAYDDILAGIELNPMAGDRRIQGSMAESGTSRLQCLLNPEFSGLPNLVRALSTL